MPAVQVVGNNDFVHINLHDFEVEDNEIFGYVSYVIPQNRYIRQWEDTYLIFHCCI